MRWPLARSEGAARDPLSLLRGRVCSTLSPALLT
jgi:hypothetical protein